ncbi:MAG: peptidase S8 [Alphaproteobacteria bacterium]|nr:MAG: peptidase S8 [Alphaproteobacteria bacterium]
MHKLAPGLRALYDKKIHGLYGGTAPAMAPEYDGYAAIDAAAEDVDALKAQLGALGAERISSFGHMVSALVPIDALDELAASNVLVYARPSLARSDAGLVTSEGDITMRSDEARAAFEVDGTGTRVGILSDSFNCRRDPASVATTMEQDIASDDLPADIIILEDLTSGCSDEGRGMGQLVHDVAPGAGLAFHTAFLGQADFANGILELAFEAGSDTIVDDVIFFAEPMFQDGIIAQAADIVNSWGIPYFSSAGNNARDSYEDDFRPVTATNGGLSGTWHDFDPGPGVDTLQDFALTTSSDFAQTTLSFQWDEPFFSVSGAPGSASDVDAVFFDSDGNVLLDCFADFDPVAFPATGGFPPLCQFGSSDNRGGDAVDLPSVVSFIGPVTVQLGFFVASGPAPTRAKYVPFDRSGGFVIAEHATDSGTAYGHTNAAGSEGVGAAFWLYTEEFTAPDTTFLGGDCVPACLNSFSSAGGIPILFDIAGKRLATPDIRQTPGIVGPDGGNTTFFVSDTSLDADSFPNFFGTSASAPHVAAVAALMIEEEEAGIVDKKGRFRVCHVPPGNPANAHDIKVGAASVLAHLLHGDRLRECDDITPAQIRAVLHATAQDMTERWTGIFRTATGFLVLVDDDPAATGFDFDTGFGMVDAFEALRALDDDEFEFAENEGEDEDNHGDDD